ncbi:hypothetical protein QLX08_010409 [Tetragonisca angustula]|uniref:Uncharacterized protein n=2 Tax=Tetragonisca angustula TaxID=166442 RepID=A0AAW0ZCE1_9HYME
MTVAQDTTIADDQQVTMEAILVRDQRTTSHRVLDHRRISPNGLNDTITTATTAAAAAAAAAAATTTSHQLNRPSTQTTITAKWCRTILDKNQRLTTVIASGTERNHPKKRRLSYDSCPVSAFYDDRRIRSRCDASVVAATTWLRLVSLLVTLLVVSVHAAPTMTPEDRRLSSSPKWVNPCGLAAEDFTGDLDVVQLTDSQLLQQVVVQAKTALTHAELFRDDYARRTFNIDFADLHSTFRDNHYDWLPGPNEIPKELGNELGREYLDELELDTALIDAYEYMQKYAVGLEQIVWDQEDLQLEFRDQFKDTEYRLRTVLCELQVALVERQLSSRPDATRDIMKSEFRNMSSSETFRNLRDWLIFRDYMNGLEYVVQVFEHLRRGLQS